MKIINQKHKVYYRSNFINWFKGSTSARKFKDFSALERAPKMLWNIVQNSDLKARPWMGF